MADHRLKRKHSRQELKLTPFVFAVRRHQALNGFLIMLTQKGKLLYISDNAGEYLGQSMVSISSPLFVSIKPLTAAGRPAQAHIDCVVSGAAGPFVGAW